MMLIVSRATTNSSNSGSQTMAFVMALQQGWSPTALRFQGTELPAVNPSGRRVHYASQQRYQGPHLLRQRRFDERVHVGMVHHETVAGLRRSSLRTPPCKENISAHTEVHLVRSVLSPHRGHRGWSPRTHRPSVLQRRPFATS